MGLLYFEYIYVINNIVELFCNITVFAMRTDFNSSYSYLQLRTWACMQNVS